MDYVVTFSTWHSLCVDHGLSDREAVNAIDAARAQRRCRLNRSAAREASVVQPSRNMPRGIIAEGFPPALGQAFAFQHRGTDRTAIAVTGEGVANQGAFHESLNLAALWKLPVVFVVEDNDWAISVPRRGQRPRPESGKVPVAFEDFGGTTVYQLPHPLPTKTAA